MNNPNPYTVNRGRVEAGLYVGAALKSLDRLDVAGAIDGYRAAIKTCRGLGLHVEADHLAATLDDIRAFGRVHAGILNTAV